MSLFYGNYSEERPKEIDMDFYPLCNVAAPEDYDAMNLKYFLRNSHRQTVPYKYLGIITLKKSVYQITTTGTTGDPLF